jgi:hypothetical protein
MASYQVKVDLIFGEKGIVRGALMFYIKFLGNIAPPGICET